MNAVFKLALFIIFGLNPAIGILMHAFPFIDQDPTLRYGLTYDANMSSTFSDSMSTNVNPQGALQNAGNAIYRVLDMMNVGFIFNFLTNIRNYVFGMTHLCDVIFGSQMNIGLRNFLFFPFVGLMDLLTITGYVIAAFTLWTGRDITQ